MPTHNSLIVLDVESYPNYFLVAFKVLNTNTVIKVSGYGEDTVLDTKQIRKVNKIMTYRVTFGFNSNKYDLMMILAAVKGKTVGALNKLSNKIIMDNLPQFKTLQLLGLDLPYKWSHIDLYEVSPGVRVSLKLYGGRMHSPKLQDLPIEPSTLLSRQQADEIDLYCENDLDTTIDLYNLLKSEIELREQMSTQYGMDMRSKSDAQIAEVVIKTAIENSTGKRLFRPNRLPTSVNYTVPDYISYLNPELNEMVTKITQTDFKINDAGNVVLPDFLAKKPIIIGTTKYKIGVGGLHSQEKSSHWISNDTVQIIDKDVASFYPSIILNEGLYPKRLGKSFLDVYGGLVERRLAAKKAGDKSTAESLKVSVNGTYGKLGSKWSVLYSPDLMLSVTLTGQLSLLLLIEMLEHNNIQVVSANTDGFVSLVRKSQYNLYQAICLDWELATGFILEDTYYQALYSRDVNNYLAIKPDGSHKGKGIFTVNSLRKNPQAEIVIEAVTNYLLNNTRLEETFLGCNDIKQFLSVRTVNGGAVWRGQEVGKVVRWAYTLNGDTIHYKKNNNKVPKSDGAEPFADLPKTLPAIDYARYEAEAIAILKTLNITYPE